ncbi:endonuclease MutS2 [Paenibacillus sp. SYP-B4298]|uniref:endonuclease MutS2 n=1 Tax=Paenibacillus sp. SYP-B4298 TaxID=2996034 RepID=UPI0022DD39A6|nr:DNA mismatch repair protein MutS [Paenibacillus sp. SYP-B4298]
MDQKVMERLDYLKVKERLEEFAVSYLGRQHIQEMRPSALAGRVRQQLDEAAEALAMVRQGASVPIPSLEGMETILALLGTGYIYSERDLEKLAQFLRSCGQLVKYMAAKQEVAPRLSSYASSIRLLRPLLGELEQMIRNGRIVDSASKELAKARKRIAMCEDKLRRKVDALVNQYKKLMQEPLVSKRGDRYVLPIKKEHRRLVKGVALDESASGQTVFMEPTELNVLQGELAALRAEEAREETKILSELSELVELSSAELRANAETVGVYDYIIARGKYAQAIGGCNVELNDEGRMELRDARHPLLAERMVPLQFRIGHSYRTLIITGPNTGGKTMALKTVGLLTLMVQSGLLVPVGEGSCFALFQKLAADIGDGQSIEHELSTFSAHITNMKQVLAEADRSTLVLIDEMASGTDPGEGVGLSIAMLEELHERGSIVIVTTHFNEIKHFAAVTPGFENARMEFDTETLEPLYRLRIGEAGESYALAIAARLGLPPRIISRSRDVMARMRQGDPSAGEQAEPLEKTLSAEASMPGAVEEEQQPAGAVNSCAEERKASSWSDYQHMEAAPAGASEQSNRMTAERNHDPMIEIEEKQPELSAESEELAAPNESEEQAGKTEQASARVKLQLGDSVYIPYLDKTGIVYALQDALGHVGVQVQGQKLRINHKRLRLHIPAAELYPPDYDLDIVFETKDNRKKRKLMSRKHVEGLFIEQAGEERDGRS